MAREPACVVAAEQDGLALGQLLFFPVDIDAGGDAVDEDCQVALQGDGGVARLAIEHFEAFLLPLLPKGLVGLARAQRLGEGMEDEGCIFAETGEVALGIVAGEGGYQLGGGLAYLEGLVNCGGLTVIVIMVGGVCAGLVGGKICWVK